MNTEVFKSGGLFGRVEPASLEKRIHLPETQSQQVLPSEKSLFLRVYQVPSSGFTDDWCGFGAYALAVFYIICDGILDECKHGRNFNTMYLQDDWRVLADGLSNVEEFAPDYGRTATVVISWRDLWRWMMLLSGPQAGKERSRGGGKKTMILVVE